MSGLDPYIFSMALTLFLLLGAVELTIEKIISLVRTIRKLKTALKDEPPSLPPPRADNDG
jgi:hypothetical protein